jgi:inhibitor of the pro-sigma K processing machinery
MELISVLVLFLVILAFAAVVYFVVRNIGHLVINSIVGLLTLFLVNYFHLMQYAGKPDIDIGWITIIICALAGLPGAILVIILALFGITL